jgi:hypothetical protein
MVTVLNVPWRELHLDVRVDYIRGYETPQLIPHVDGSVLGLGLDTRADSPESGLGMDPDDLLGRHGALLPPEPGGMILDVDETPARATVWRCGCGEVWDASIGVRVYRVIDPVAENDAVVWDDWRLSSWEKDRLATPGRLEFHTQAYYAECIRAQADRWWESVPHRTARELAAVLDARPEILGQWGAALFCTETTLRSEQHQGTIAIRLRDSLGAYELGVPCRTTADPVAEANRIAERLRKTDPTRWTETSTLRR